MNNIDYAKISSDNVKLLLLRNKVSIRQLAEKIGIAQTTLNDALKSKKGISIDSLIKIADYFNLTVNDLCNPYFIKINSNDKTHEEILFNKISLLDVHGRNLVALVVDKELERLMNES